MSKKPKNGSSLGYLPDETPSLGKLLIFAFQQVLVMFPATVTVALLTGFHVSTTIFASGFATICFLLVTKGKIPLYFGSSFSYIAAVVGITGTQFGEIASDSLISEAQFGIMASGVVSIVVGLIVSRFGMESIEKVLPPTVTGSIALIIGISLAGTAMTQAAGWNAEAGAASNNAWIAALVTLVATVAFSVYLKGIWGQLPILLGILVGYLVSIPLGLIDFSIIMSDGVLQAPHFTLPKPSATAILAIMPIAVATIPESTAHLFQLDIYVNNLAKKKGKGEYDIANRLGSNLVGDGIGDIVASVFGGPGGTNYGENISTMAITKNFSVRMLGTAAIISMIISFFAPLANLINTVPGSVINGACIFLFGVIGAQGIAIMINKKVDMFDARNLSIISITLVVGLGGHYGFPNGLIPIFGMELPAIATAAIVGIVLNLLLSIGRKKAIEEASADVEAIEEATEVKSEEE